MHLVEVRDIEESFFKEARGAMGNHAVSLHLAKSEASVASTSRRGLSGEDLSGTSATRVNFILHHVLEALVVRRAQKDHHLHLLSSEAIVHDLVAAKLVSQAVKLA